MKRSIKTIALLCLGIPLLMANSPAPIAHEEEYQGAEINILRCDPIPGDSSFEFEYSLKNTGNGYLSTDFRYYPANYQDYEYIDGLLKDGYFYDSVIAPGDTKTIVGKTSYDFNNDSPQTGDFSFNGYPNILSDITVYFDEELEFYNKSSNGFYYSIDILSLSGSLPRYSSYAVTIEIDGIDYCVVCRVDPIIEAYKEIDLSKTKVKKVEVVYSDINYHGDVNGMGVLGELLRILLTFVGIFSLGIVCLGAFVIAPAIVIPKIVRNARRRRKENQNEK